MKRASLSRTSLWGWPGILALSIVLLDHLTKFLVCRHWPVPGVPVQEIVVIPGFFRLVHWRNSGAAWGIFAGHPWLLGVISLLAALSILFFWRKITCRNPCYALSFGVLLGGILGNMVDRLFFRAGVVDFLRFEFWPAFNLADSAICCSVGFLLVYDLFFARKDSPRE